jgi:hypothetical protein
VAGKAYQGVEKRHECGADKAKFGKNAQFMGDKCAI